MYGMNGWKTREEVQEIKAMYPVGTRIRLGYMEDPHAPPGGTEGTVQHVDSQGQLLVEWDNGQTLSVIPDHDMFSKVRQQEQGTTMQMGV